MWFSIWSCHYGQLKLISQITELPDIFNSEAKNKTKIFRVRENLRKVFFMKIIKRFIWKKQDTSKRRDANGIPNILKDLHRQAGKAMEKGAMNKSNWKTYTIWH